MLKVYALTEDFYVEGVLNESGKLVGIFSNNEKAKNQMTKIIQYHGRTEVLFHEVAEMVITDTGGFIRGKGNGKEIRLSFRIEEYDI